MMNRLLFHTASSAILMASLSLGAQAKGLEPGYWQFWKTDNAVPTGVPTASFCVSEKDGADPLVLVGTVPNDSDCQVTGANASGGDTVNFDLSCNNGRVRYKGTSIMSNGRFVTATVTIGQNYQKLYVHGVRVDRCAK